MFTWDVYIFKYLGLKLLIAKFKSHSLFGLHTLSYLIFDLTHLSVLTDNQMHSSTTIKIFTQTTQIRENGSSWGGPDILLYKFTILIVILIAQPFVNVIQRQSLSKLFCCTFVVVIPKLSLPFWGLSVGWGLGPKGCGSPCTDRVDALRQATHTLCLHF